MGFFASIISLAINKGKISETDYRFELEQYNGINNHQVPMRIYYSKKKTNKTAIMFLGASPDGEEHKSINYLAKILTKFNYNVFIPRIPPLMQLNISNKNVDWIKYLYELITLIHNREPDTFKNDNNILSSDSPVIEQECL